MLDGAPTAEGGSMIEASSSARAVSASRLALRLSCTRAIWMASSSSNVSASPSAVIENGSEPGVNTAANTNIAKIRPRRHDRSRSYVSTPTKLSITTSSGNSKLTPNTSSRLIRNPKYRSPDRAVTCTSLPTVNRKCSALASTRYASTAPVTKSSAAGTTNATAKRRSFLYSPGVMKAQSWYSHIGQASTTPAVNATFNRSMNWSNGAVASSRHWPVAMSARAVDGSAQYGCRSHSPRLSSPNNGCEYQTKPIVVVRAIMPSESKSRARNSVRCATSDMVASGLVRLRRRRGSSRLNNPVVRTVNRRSGAAG